MKEGSKDLVVWQIAGGPSSRSYVDVFLKYGVALIGPGDSGRWTPERGDEEFEGRFVRQFANEVKIGDVFLLRKSISTICATGIVASEYMYCNQFDDVNGWDLQHGRRVCWYKLPQEYKVSNRVFGSSPSRFSKVHSEEMIDFTRRFVNSPPFDWQTAQLPALPEEEPLLNEVPDYLQEIVSYANDLYPIMWDREKYPDHPSEDELIAHLVVPFLRALGWQPENIAVQWQYIDVAVFDTLPRTPKNCRFIIEAKRLGAGVEGALEQVRNYVQKLTSSTDVVVTDGIRYRMYSSKNNFDPLAYANLVRIKKPALELFERMKRP